MVLRISKLRLAMGQDRRLCYSMSMDRLRLQPVSTITLTELRAALSELDAQEGMAMRQWASFGEGRPPFIDRERRSDLIQQIAEVERAIYRATGLPF